MQPKLNPQFFSDNRKALIAKLADKLPIVIAANGLVQRTADSTLPFTQDSSFWYLTGLDTPDAVLVLAEAESFLIVPHRSAVRETFEGAIDSADLTSRSGVSIILSEVEGWQRIAAHVAVHAQASYLKPLPVYDTRHGFFANPARRRVIDKLRRLQPGLTLYDARPELASLRCVKQPIEIEHIRHAVQITKATLAELTASSEFAKMKYEYEIEAAITCGMRKRGADGHAYNPIVAGGQNATTLHYEHNGALLSSTDYIVVDVGAEVAHYAADITRTLIQGTPSERQLAIYNAVERLQQAAIMMLKPGVIMRDFEQAFEGLMGSELVRLGLISEASDHHAIRRYYPHATSHFLGLDVHDAGDYSQPLTNGMVLTCEPGIYIPEEGIGVRIEDDILITESASIVL